MTSPAVKRIASGVAAAAAMFAGLGTVAALWENPLFTRMSPTSGFEIALLLLLSVLAGIYVGLPRTECGQRSMKLFVPIVALAAAVSAASLAHHEAGGQHPAQAQAPAVSARTGKGTGVIQRIDGEKRIVTIKHGPLQGINIPAMTMSYVAKDKATLSNLRPQQNVEFEITYENRRYFITGIR